MYKTYTEGEEYSWNSAQQSVQSTEETDKGQNHRESEIVISGYIISQPIECVSWLVNYNHIALGLLLYRLTLGGERWGEVGSEGRENEE